MEPTGNTRSPDRFGYQQPQALYRYTGYAAALPGNTLPAGSAGEGKRLPAAAAGAFAQLVAVAQPSNHLYSGSYPAGKAFAGCNAAGSQSPEAESGSKDAGMAYRGLCFAYGTPLE